MSINLSYLYATIRYRQFFIEKLKKIMIHKGNLILDPSNHVAAVDYYTIFHQHLLLHFSMALGAKIRQKKKEYKYRIHDMKYDIK